jgi:hypothetical protein
MQFRALPATINFASPPLSSYIHLVQSLPLCFERVTEVCYSSAPSRRRLATSVSERCSNHAARRSSLCYLSETNGSSASENADADKKRQPNVDDGTVTDVDGSSPSVKRSRDSTGNDVDHSETKPDKPRKRSTLEDATSSATLSRLTQEGLERLSLCGMPGGQRKAKKTRAAMYFY